MSLIWHQELTNEVKFKIWCKKVSTFFFLQVTLYPRKKNTEWEENKKEKSMDIWR